MRNGNCKVCTSKDRKKIERHILAGKYKPSVLAKRFKVPTRSIKNHKDKHLTAEIAHTMRTAMPELKAHKVAIQKNVPNINNLKACLEYIYAESLDIHKTAKEAGKGGLSLHALKQAHDCINTAMKGHELLLSYESQGSWEKILPRLNEALKDMPEAQLAISMALRTPKAPVDAGSKIIDVN